MKSSKIIYQGDKLRIFLLLFQRQVKLGVKQYYDGIASYIGGAIAAQDKRNMIMLWWNPMQLMNFHLGLNRGLQLRKRRKMYMSPSLGDSIKCWNAVECRLIVRTPTFDLCFNRWNWLGEKLGVEACFVVVLTQVYLGNLSVTDFWPEYNQDKYVLSTHNLTFWANKKN